MRTAAMVTAIAGALLVFSYMVIPSDEPRVKMVGAMLMLFGILLGSINEGVR